MTKKISHKKTKKNPKGAGQKRNAFDFDQFEKLCGLMCTLEEIEGFMGVSHDTIERLCKQKYKKDFKEVRQDFGAQGKVSLRRSQFIKAQTGDSTMLIWLGKQYLGQRDSKDLNLAGELNIGLGLPGDLTPEDIE